MTLLPPFLGECFRAVVLSLWVETIRTHMFPVVLGTETLLSSKIAIMN